MSVVLFISTLFLDLAGIAFAVICIWMNVFSRTLDLEERNVYFIRFARLSVIFTLIFALFTCLLSDAEFIEETMHLTMILYGIICISWLAVLVFCIISTIYTLASRIVFRKNALIAIRKIVTIALCGGLISFVVSWLFS